MFTGTIVLPASVTGGSSAAASTVVGGAGNAGSSALLTVANSTAAGVGEGGRGGGRPPRSPCWSSTAGGSSCCNDVDGLRAELPGFAIRQFSYLGLGPDGHPLASGPSADDLPLPELGDRLASQVEALHAATRKPVDVVAESEGSLGVYAMLDRHPGLPVGAVVLLSPIVEPGQLSYPPGADGSSVSEEALDELNYLIGSMSPFGPDGAAELLNLVSEFGARYFASAAACWGRRQGDPLAGGGAARGRGDAPGLRPAVGRPGGPRPARRPARRPERAAGGRPVRVGARRHRGERLRAPRRRRADHRRRHRLADAGRQRVLPG